MVERRKKRKKVQSLGKGFLEGTGEITRGKGPGKFQISGAIAKGGLGNGKRKSGRKEVHLEAKEGADPETGKGIRGSLSISRIKTNAPAEDLYEVENGLAGSFPNP